MRILSLDIETYSPLDLSTVGYYKYSENCVITLLAYAYDDEPVQIVDLAMGESLPFNLITDLSDRLIMKSAYNAAFELTVLEKYLNTKFDPQQWQCTMVQALSLGLPASLQQVGQILKIESDKRKLATGKKLINFFSKPRKVSSLDLQQPNLWGDMPSERNLPGDNPEKWKEFKEYCKRDVEAERTIRKKLSKYSLTTNMERALWKLDHKINDTGVWTDTDFVEKAIRIDEVIKTDMIRKGKLITGDININSNSQMLHWINEQEGCSIKSLDKATRAKLLKGSLTKQVRDILVIKERLCKISTRKFGAMKATVCLDHRVRGMFKLNGANRTGRWSGWGIQLHNLPQNHIKDLDIARQLVQKGNALALQLFFENPIDVLSQLIRTAFVAPEGSHFIVADFSSIESRVLSWLADEKWRMEVFAEGGDIYCASASEMFKVPVEKHGVNKELRVKGKLTELACGYGGGTRALKAFGADKMGLSDDDLKTMVTNWRKANPNICLFWRIMERCALIAVRDKTKKYCQKGIAFECVDNFLFVYLPSGRKISYYNPKIVTDPVTGTEFLTYEGTTQANGSWGTVSTWGGKLVENLVQAIARDCLAAVMLKLNAKGYKIVMHVHDEVICEMPKTVGSLDEVLSIMRQPLWWAKGLVLDAEGYTTQYYRKD